jgi:pimeloyl-ACP methyl ester carboxylesterase
MGGPLYHLVNGEGEPLMLLNGIAMSAASWESIALPLEGHYRVIRFDFRGQLMSPGKAPRDAGLHAQDVVELLDHLDIDRVHLVATSFGAAIGALVAARFPERVRSLVSIASADGFDDVMATEVSRWREGTIASLEGGDKGWISDVLESTVYSSSYLEAHADERTLRRRQIASLPDTWFHGLAGLLDSTDSVVLARELAAIRCPTLIVAAELDGFIPLDRTRALVEGIAGARFELMEGAGHAVVVEQPERLVELTLDFLREL